MDCLRVMDHDLRLNMCNLTPDEWYKNRAQLRGRILNYVSPHLAYACTYWVSHLNAGLDKEVGPDAEVTFLLKVFASKHLFPWVEALSIIGHVDTVVPSLNIACRAMQFGGTAETRRDALQDDTKQLDREYALHSSANTAQALFSDMCELGERSSKSLGLSPLNIYHSALPFVSHRTALYHAYKLCHTARVDVRCDSKESWDPEIAVLRGHTDTVLHVRFSPDSSRLASVSRDKTVRLWDGRTGAYIATLMGHSDLVHSLMFSPRGLTLVSGSNETILLWDGRTGARIAIVERLDNDDGVILTRASVPTSLIVEPIRRHHRLRRFHAAHFIEFSPDGTRHHRTIPYSSEMGSRAPLPVRFILI